MPTENKEDYRKKESRDLLTSIKRVRDFVQGSDKVKAEGVEYLPKPIESGNIIYDNKRYKAYVKRACFFNATGNTLDNLLGELFRVEPRVELKPPLEFLAENVDGGGNDLQTFLKTLAGEVIQTGLTGILVDYPFVDREKVISIKDKEDLGLTPQLKTIKREDIINWNYNVKDNRKQLEFLVIREDYTDPKDRYSENTIKRLREFEIVNGQVVTRVKESESASQLSEAANYSKTLEAVIVGLDGKPLKEIPFIAVGSKHNCIENNPLPLGAIAILNESHYRNSADDEESSFMVGQPTPVIKHISEDWFNRVLGGKLNLGARTAIPLEHESSDVTLLQAEPNTMPLTRMQHKEEQMRMLGASLVMEKGGNTTATEKVLDASSELSVLANISVNISKGVNDALKFAILFTGGEVAKDTILEINQDFDAGIFDNNQVSSIQTAYRNELISRPETRDLLRKAGWKLQDDDSALEDIKKDNNEEGEIE